MTFAVILILFFKFWNYEIIAVVGVAQWIECWPLNQKVTSSIPTEGTCLGCRPGPHLGACDRQPVDVSLAHWCFSPSLSPFLPFSLKVNKIFKKINNGWMKNFNFSLIAITHINKNSLGYSLSFQCVKISGAKNCENCCFAVLKSVSGFFIVIRSNIWQVYLSGLK